MDWLSTKEGGIDIVLYNRTYSVQMFKNVPTYTRTRYAINVLHMWKTNLDDGVCSGRFATDKDRQNESALSSLQLLPICYNRPSMQSLQYAVCALHGSCLGWTMSSSGRLLSCVHIRHLAFPGSGLLTPSSPGYRKDYVIV